MGVKIVRLFIIGLLLMSLSIIQPTQAQQDTKEMIYIEGYEKIYAIDPETKDLTEIPVKGAVRGLSWTEDGTRLYAATNARQSITVIDTVKNEVIDEIDLSTSEYTSRRYGHAADLKGEFLYVTVMRTKINGVNLEPLQPIIQVIDLETHEFVKEIEVPYGVHTLQMYADGSKLAVWGRNLYEYDIEKDELTLHAETMRPEDESKGISDYLYFWVRGEDTNNLSIVSNYKFYPETEDMTEGYITWDLEIGDVDYVEFDEEPVGYFSGVITKDGKYSYGGMNELVKTDLETMKHVKRVPAELGSSYGFNISSDEKTIYVSGAGPDLSFYDADTLELTDSIELPTDTMDIRVIEVTQ